MAASTLLTGLPPSVVERHFRANGEMFYEATPESKKTECNAPGLSPREQDYTYSLVHKTSTKNLSSHASHIPF